MGFDLAPIGRVAPADPPDAWHRAVIGRLTGRLQEALDLDDVSRASICVEVADQLNRMAAQWAPAQSDCDRIEQLRKALDLKGRGAPSLLLKLIDTPDHVHSHHKLKEELGYGYNSLKVFLSHIRHGLENCGMDGDVITTVWGVGYSISAAAAAHIIDFTGSSAPRP